MIRDLLRPRLVVVLAVAAAAIALMVALPGSVAAKDRNHDRIPDRWERRHGLSLSVKQTHRDQDRDKLVNRKEFLAGMDPHDGDSDGDGVKDGDEGAGTIASFDADTGRLVINDFVGGSASGLVTEDTEIKCDDGDDHGDEDGDHHGGDHGDRSGPGHGDDDGDDNSGPGNGDDEADDHSGPGHGDDEGDDDERECSTADLVPGAMVQEAELELTSEGFVFEEIELLD